MVKDIELVPALRIPHTGRAIIACSQHALPIIAKERRAYRAVVLEHEQGIFVVSDDGFLSRATPDVSRIIPARGHQLRTVRAEPDSHHTATVPEKRTSEREATLDIPHSCSLVVASRSK